jgi:hypothetical protein
MHRRSSALAAASFLVAVAPLAADTGNLLTNGGFAASVAGWSEESQAVLEWSPVDGNGGAGGSALVRNRSTGAGNGTGISQCAGGVSGGLAYTYGGRVQLPAGQARTGFAAIGLRFYSGEECAGSVVGSQPRQNVFGADAAFVVLQESGVVPPAARSVEFVAFPSKVEAGGELIARFDDLTFTTASCAGSDTALCLNLGRFRVEVQWETPAGASGVGHAVGLTEDTGYFWFFDAANVELVVKVLNGCGLNARYWVFAGGLTNVRTVIRVVDTETGEVETYVNPQGQKFRPVQDTSAFATCP